MEQSITGALQRRGYVKDITGAGLQNHSIYGQPVVAAGKKRKAKPKAGKKAKPKPKAKKKVKVIADGEEKEVEAVEGGKKGKGKGKGKGKRKPNPWLIHVAQFKKSHPKLKYSDILKQAKNTYKKV